MIYVEDVCCFLFVCSHSDMDVLNRIFPSSFASLQCWCKQLDNGGLLSVVPLKTLITLQNKEMLIETEFFPDFPGHVAPISKTSRAGYGAATSGIKCCPERAVLFSPVSSLYNTSMQSTHSRSGGLMMIPLRHLTPKNLGSL